MTDYIPHIISILFSLSFFISGLLPYKLIVSTKENSKISIFNSFKSGVGFSFGFFILTSKSLSDLSEYIEFKEEELEKTKMGKVILHFPWTYFILVIGYIISILLLKILANIPHKHLNPSHYHMNEVDYESHNENSDEDEFKNRINSRRLKSFHSERSYESECIKKTETFLVKKDEKNVDNHDKYSISFRFIVIYYISQSLLIGCMINSMNTRIDKVLYTISLWIYYSLEFFSLGMIFKSKTSRSIKFSMGLFGLIMTFIPVGFIISFYLAKSNLLFNSITLALFSGYLLYQSVTEGIFAEIVFGKYRFLKYFLFYLGVFVVISIEVVLKVI